MTITNDELSNILIFHGVELKVLRDIITGSHEIEVEAGTLLLSPDYPNEYVYIILDGSMSICAEPDGEILLSLLGPGECAGDMSVLDHDVPSAYAIVNESSRFLRLDARQVWALINNSHSFARNMLIVLSHRVRHNTQAVADGVRLQHKHELSALLDSLTGLHNRRSLENTFRRESTLRDIQDNNLCLLMMDVDNFKLYNDTHGHVAGDQALKTAAKVLQSVLRDGDLLVRFGGEEFVVLMPATDIGLAIHLAKTLCNSIANEIIIWETKILPSITASIGVAKMQGAEPLEELVQRADKAMYLAKRNGKNCIYCANE
ncbi:MAG: GGDEF domain-containing protein [Mariprofundales bacterium]